MPRKSHNENDLCKWVSSKLTGVTVKGYPESFADGVIFCRLVETLTNQSIKDAIPNPKAYDDKLVNMGLAVAFLEAALRAHLEKVRPSLLAAGDASEVGSFLSFIILEFDSAAPICAGLETKVKKKNVSGTALEYTLPARLPGKGPKIFDTEDEKKKKKPRRSYFRWPAENTTERISTNTLPLITLRKNIYSKFQYDVEVNEAPTMEDIDKVITEETRFININASIHQQEIEHKIATKMTIKELQTIGKRKYENGKGLDCFPSSLTSQIPIIAVCDLSCNNISSFPEALLMGKSLENIYLSCNKLRRLPSLAGPEVHLSALTLLDLSQNPIEYLPASLFQLPKLETLILARCGLNKLDLPLEGVRPVCPALRRLDISHNNFTELPESLALMSSLEVLNVSSNNLTYFPRCIAEMGKLTEVWANSNRLAVLPEELPQSVQLLVANSNEVESVPRNWALPALTTLALAYNRLTKLYSGFFDAFPSLTSLDLSANRLSSMPRVSSPHLTSLRVAGNRLSDIALSQEALTGLVVLDVSHNNLSTLHNLSAATGLEVLNIAHNKLGTAIQLAVLPRTLVRVNVACCGINDELGSSSSSSSSSTSNYGDSVLSLPRLETLCAQGNNIKQIGFETISASKSLIFADLSLNSFSQSAVPAPIINNLFVRKTVCCSSADTVWGSAAYCNMRAPTPSCSLPVVTEAIAPGCTLYALYDCCGTDCKQVAASVAAAVSAHVRKGLSTKHPSVPALLAEAVRSANTLFSEDPMDPLQGCGALLVLVDSVASVVHTASLGAAAAAIVSNTSAKWLAQGQDPLSAEEYSRIHTADPNAFVTADGRLMGVFAGSRGLGCKILGAALSDEPVVGKTELGGDDSNSDDDEEEEKNEFIVMASERVWKMAPLVGFIGPFVVDTYKKTKRNASLTAASLRDWCLGSCADDPQNYASLATLVVPISRK